MSDETNDPVTPEHAEGQDPSAKPAPVKKGVVAKMRGYFFAGMLVTAPIAITVYLAWIFINFVDSQVGNMFPPRFNPETYLPFATPGLGLVIVIAVLIAIGWVAASFLGRFFHKSIDRVLAQVPVVRNLYSTVKQIFETVLAQRSNAFREAVLVEYPRRGMWAIGFITGRTEEEVQNLTVEETVNIFLPTTPNPTSGFLLFLPRKDVIPLSMSVEEAIKMVISGGIVTPPDRRPKAKRDKPTVSAATYEELDIAREKDNTPVLIPRENK
ncbi:MAG: DUF502 domain-containing protein [Rhodospirillales bacterium]|jgi:uncharacterized membrane protein|nr:DUF502 domain-containing protein [Rhodospirillales bacterium]